MLGPAIDEQMRHLPPSERPARNHALHRLHQNALGELAAEDLERAPLLDAAGMVRMAVIDLVLHLVAGEDDLLRIDDDDMVAVVHMRGEGGLMLAAKAHGDDGCDAADNQALGIDQNPLFLNVRWFCGIGSHGSSPVRSGRAAPMKKGPRGPFAEEIREEERAVNSANGAVVENYAVKT